MAAAVGTIIDDRELATRGVRLQVIGLAIVSAAVFTAAIRFVGLVPPGTEITTIPEIQGRLAPDFLSLAVALGAGIAGAISLTTGAGAALVGVMIAVALIPPAATVGIGLAWGQPLVILGSGVFVLVNVLSINLAALVVLWVIGYRPQDAFPLEEARATLVQRVRVLVLALLVLSVFLAGVTYLSYQSSQFEQQAEQDVREVLDDQPYRDLALLDVSVESSARSIAFNEVGLAAGGPITVSVTVDQPSGTEYPEFAAALDRRITQHTGHDVIVEVRFVDADRTASA